MPPRDPWTILGVPRTATAEEIRAQYRKLALALHPDKQGAHLTPEQKKESEERFKEVSVAYQVATDIAKARESGCGFQDPAAYEDYEKWRGMWERVEEMIRSQNLVSVLKDAVKGTLHDMARLAVKRIHRATRAPCDDNDDASNASNASDISSNVDSSDDEHTPNAQTADSAQTEQEQEPEEHTFKLPVTLDEVHTKASRKVRLFLHGHPQEPVIVSIDFEQFPEMVYHHSISNIQHKIIIEMIPKQHPVYYWDPLLDGWDLYTTLPISLHEYIMGCTKTIPRLGHGQNNSHDESLLLQVPAFPGLKSPIVYEGAGLRGKGNLYVMLEVVLPTKDNWETLKKESPGSTNEFLCCCKKLENLNAAHRTPS